MINLYSWLWAVVPGGGALHQDLGRGVLPGNDNGDPVYDTIRKLVKLSRN